MNKGVLITIVLLGLILIYGVSGCKRTLENKIEIKVISEIEPPSPHYYPQEIYDLQNQLMNRFNSYNVLVSVKPKYEENSYIFIVESNISKKDLREITSDIIIPGKFEAKIGDEVIFTGGKEDIVSICKNDLTCAKTEECSQTEEGYYCGYSFAIVLSEEAAQKQADATANLLIEDDYLNETLELYLDDKLVDSLKILANLKGKNVTEMAISGPGRGKTQEDAYGDALRNMLKLQTVLITGQLPVELEVAE